MASISARSALATGALKAPGRMLSIGQVLARLTPEFPDLVASKLRFLEDQGLVHPARTESGYRKFSAADLDRLRVILTMQRDHYLPLKVIRGILDDIDAGRRPQLPVSSAEPKDILTPPQRRWQREDLLRETGAMASLLDDAIATGLITAARDYGPEAVALMRALVELRRTGIEPRHLRALRLAAEREAELITSALTPLMRTPSDRAAVVDRANEVAGQLDRVRSSIVRAAIGRIGRP